MAIDYTDLVNKGYQNTLGRAGDQAGVDYWKGQLSSGAVTPEDFNKSLLSGAKPGEFTPIIEKGYQDVLGRATDPAGSEYWRQQLRSGGVTPSGFQSSLLVGSKGDEVMDLIKKGYKDVLGREADPAGLQYWTDEIKAGRVDPSRINEAILSGQKEPSISDLFQPGKFPTSRSGIGQEYLDSIMGAVTPRLTESIGKLPGQAAAIGENARELGSSQGREALKFAAENVMESLGNRNIANSSVTSGALGRATGDVARNLQNLGFQSGIETGKAEMQVPGILAGIAELGNVSESQQPNVPYEALQRFILGLS